jgi:hypothetical protein
MSEIHQRLQSRLETMNGELNGASPHQRRVAEQARTMEREMNQWNKQYENIGSDLGLQE